MMRRFSCLFALFIGAGSYQAGAQTVVSGRVLGADGEVMPATHVELRSFYGGRQALRVIPAPGGRYQVDIADRGLVRLTFMGPLHKAHTVVVLAEDEPVELDVQLQRAWMDTDQSYTRIATDHTRFEYDLGVPLEEQADGSFAAMVEAPDDTLIYEMPAATSQVYAGWVFGEISADRFVYTPKGYRAAVASPEAQVRVTVRPRRLGTEEAPKPVIIFGAANRRAGILWEFYQELQKAGRFQFTRAVQASRASFSSALSEERERAARDRENVLRQEILALEIDIERETDPFRRELLLMRYLSQTSGIPFFRQSVYRFGVRFGLEAIIEPNPIYLKRAIEVIDPASMGWAVHPALLQVLVEQTKASAAAVAYVEAVKAGHPVAAVQRFAFFNLIDGLFARHGLTPEVVAYLEQYQQRYGEDDELLEDNLPLGRPLKVAAGRRAPGFLASSRGRRRGVLSDSLEDRVVLLDFWASWCDACARDEDALRQARAAYGHGDFQIMRAVLDLEERPEEAPGEMPWLLYQGADGFKSPIAAGYEVMTLPHRVLIDRDGVVLAVGGELFGERLMQTLERVFLE